MARKIDYIPLPIPIESHRKLVRVTQKYPIPVNQIVGGLLVYAAVDEDCLTEIMRFAEDYHPRGSSTQRGVIHLPRHHSRRYNRLKSGMRAVAFNYGLTSCLTDSPRWRDWHNAAITAFANEVLSLIS